MSAGSNAVPQHFIIIGLALQEYTERQFAQPGVGAAAPVQGAKPEFVPAGFASSKKKFKWRIERI
jgi:hypothetical protein